MKKYRLYFMNINSGAEFSIEVNNNDEILPALKSKPQYVREPDNWECFDQEEIRDNPPEETFTAFLYEDDGIKGVIINFLSIFEIISHILEHKQ